jgi:putative peptide zinc metalloprotease protein
MVLEGRLAEAEAAVETLQTSRIKDSSASDQIETAEEVRKAARKQYEEKLQEAERLTVVAPIAGTVSPPPHRSDKQAAAEGRLATWNGSPFDEKNIGATFTPTDLICQIGDPKDLEAVMIVEQSYIDLVREGHPVRVLLESQTRRAYDTEVVEIASSSVKAVPASMSAQAGGRLETVTDPSTGMMRPLNTSYQVRAPLANKLGSVQVGLQGQARIFTGWQPLGRRIYRYVTKTFHFDL